MDTLIKQGNLYSDGTCTDFVIIDESGNAVFKGTMDREGDTWSIADPKSGRIIRTHLSWDDVLKLVRGGF